MKETSKKLKTSHLILISGTFSDTVTYFTAGFRFSFVAILPKESD